MAALPRPSAAALTRVCLAALVANMGIVLTGALVRLTGSGLGCPTWPRCTGSSYVNTPEYGVHGVIEFGNRTLTFVLGVVVITCIVATMLHRQRRRDLVRLSWALLAGIAGQAVLGGITVRTHLNPWTVAAHFLLSMVLVAAAAALHLRSREAGRPDADVPPGVRRIGLLVTGLTAVVLVLGTVVTGTGPHAGDRAAARTGFDPVTVTRLHAAAVLLLVGLTIASVVALRRARGPRRSRRTAVILLALELGQGAVGYLQYVDGVPVVLVGLHVAGACLVWLAAVRLALVLSARPAKATAEQVAIRAPASAAGAT